MLRWTLCRRAARPVTAWVGGRSLDLDHLATKLEAAGVGARRFSPAATTTTPVTAAGRHAAIAPGAGATFATAGDAQSQPLQAAPAIRAAARPHEVLLFSVPVGWEYQAAVAKHGTRPTEVVDAGKLTPVVGSDPKPAPHGTTRTFVVFGEGAMVGWNAEWADLLAVWRLAVEASGGTTPANTVTEQLTYVTRGETADADADAAEGEDVVPEVESYIDEEHDRIVLADDGDETLMLPFSYALIQSVKIDVIESTLAPLVRSVKQWQRQLAQSGKLRCSLRQLRQSKTSLFALLEQLNFSHGPQTTPKLFWAAEHQRHRAAYKLAKEHLELEDRLEFLQDRIDTVEESLAYLHEELHVSTEEFLTWVIIWLIVAEIALALDIHNRLMALGRMLVGSAAPPVEEAVTDGAATDGVDKVDQAAA